MQAFFCRKLDIDGPGTKNQYVKELIISYLYPFYREKQPVIALFLLVVCLWLIVD